MTPPDDTPPKWLYHSNPTCSDGSGAVNALYGPSTALANLVEEGREHFEDMPYWLGWRSRVAEALGLITEEDARAVISKMRDDLLSADNLASVEAAVRLRIAAELRRLADVFDVLPDEQKYEWQAHELAPGVHEAVTRLRARAAELDGGK